MDQITEYILNKEQFDQINELLVQDYNNMDDLVEQLLNEASINIEKAQDAMSKNIKVAKQFLKDRGISLANLKVQSKKAVEMAKNGQKAKKDPKAVSSDIINKVITPTVKKAIKGAKFDASEESDLPLHQKILFSIAILITIIIVQQFLLGLVAGVSIATISNTNVLKKVILVVMAVIIAPITEEFAKRIAIKEKYPWVYTSIFAGFEGLIYVFKLVAMGANVPAAIIIRVIALLMHFITTYVQKYLSDKVEAGELSETWDIMGYYSAVAIHATYNFIGVVLNDEIGALIGV